MRMKIEGRRIERIGNERIRDLGNVSKGVNEVVGKNIEMVWAC